MQFPMDRDDRSALTAIADDLAELERRSAGFGLDFLALLLSHAREEAVDRLNDDTLARIERRDRGGVDLASAHGEATAPLGE